jgi:hypothetical protein
MIDGAFGVEAENLRARAHPRGGVWHSRTRLLQEWANSFEVEEPAQLQAGQKWWQHGATLRISGGEPHLI